MKNKTARFILLILAAACFFAAGCSSSDSGGDAAAYSLVIENKTPLAVGTLIFQAKIADAAGNPADYADPEDLTYVWSVTGENGEEYAVNAKGSRAEVSASSPGKYTVSVTGAGTVNGLPAAASGRAEYSVSEPSYKITITETSPKTVGDISFSSMVTDQHGNYVYADPAALNWTWTAVKNSGSDEGFIITGGDSPVINILSHGRWTIYASASGTVNGEEAFLTGSKEITVYRELMENVQMDVAHDTPKNGPVNFTAVLTNGTADIITLNYYYTFSLNGAEAYKTEIRQAELGTDPLELTETVDFSNMEQGIYDVSFTITSGLSYNEKTSDLPVSPADNLIGSNGQNHAIIINKDLGTYYAWGDNQYGQLGNGTSADSNTPRFGMNYLMRGARDFYAGANSSFLVTESGSLYSWGENSGGQLGIGNYDNQAEPRQVEIERVYSVTSGKNHTAAVTEDGLVYAWGNNENGQLGTGENGQAEYNSPQTVKNTAGDGPLDNIASAAAGMSHTLFMTKNGEARAVGLNRYGQLGNNTQDNASVPVSVLNDTGTQPVSDIKAIYAGYWTSFILKNDGTLFSFGSNQGRNLGAGISAANTNKTLPVQVIAADGAAGGLENVKAVALHLGSTQTVSAAMALLDNGSAVSWGTDQNGSLGTGGGLQMMRPPSSVKMPEGITFKKIFSGYSGRKIALGSDGNIYVWGKNKDGFLGTGGASDQKTPVKLMFPF